MGAGRAIKQIMIERNISVKNLAELLNIQAQSMSNKLYRDSFTYVEVEHIADLLNCDVKMVTRDTNKVFM